MTLFDWMMVVPAAIIIGGGGWAISAWNIRRSIDKYVQERDALAVLHDEREATQIANEVTPPTQE
ncbi:MAG TPA: hypothetical protein VGE65_06925 [Sphingobium sp.]